MPSSGMWNRVDTVLTDVFGGTYRLHLKGIRNPRARTAFLSFNVVNKRNHTDKNVILNSLHDTVYDDKLFKTFRFSC
jgi:hypothetical protein